MLKNIHFKSLKFINNMHYCIRIRNFISVDCFYLDFDVYDSIKLLSDNQWILSMLHRQSRHLNGAFCGTHIGKKPWGGSALPPETQRLYGWISAGLTTYRPGLRIRVRMFWSDTDPCMEKSSFRSRKIFSKRWDLEPVFFRGSHPDPV